MNQSKPGLDLALTYGTLGFGGTQVVPAGSEGSARQAGPRSYGGALSDALTAHYPTWAVGLNFSYPILNRAASTAVARAQVGRDLAAAQVAVLEQSVIAEVRDAARSVELGFARVREAREALGFQQQRLDAEMERFKAGKSSAFFVIQAQRDMVITQLTERDAVAAYRRSLVRYERVQAAGISAEGYLQ
jgi:outer membrane protein TolC